MQRILEAPYSHRFMVKVLHHNEILQIQRLPLLQNKVQYLASRWAAKEALVKASKYKELVFPDVEIAVSMPL